MTLMNRCQWLTLESCFWSQLLFLKKLACCFMRGTVRRRPAGPSAERQASQWSSQELQVRLEEMMKVGTVSELRGLFCILSLSREDHTVPDIQDETVEMRNTYTKKQQLQSTMAIHPTDLMLDGCSNNSYSWPPVKTPRWTVNIQLKPLKKTGWLSSGQKGSPHSHIAFEMRRAADSSPKDLNHKACFWTQPRLSKRKRNIETKQTHHMYP